MVTKFIMLIGIAGSGKSTLAANLATTGTTIISSDAIRGELYGDESIQGSAAEVFQLMESRTLKALTAGNTVIYDATNVVAQHRRKLLAKLPSDIRRECIWVKVPIARALKNNQRRARHVPEWVIHRMANQLEPPTPAEGWDDIQVVTY